MDRAAPDRAPPIGRHAISKTGPPAVARLILQKAVVAVAACSDVLHRPSGRTASAARVETRLPFLTRTAMLGRTSASEVWSYRQDPKTRDAVHCSHAWSASIQLMLGWFIATMHLARWWGIGHWISLASLLSSLPSLLTLKTSLVDPIMSIIARAARPMTR